MSTSSIVRIACDHNGKQQYWTVQQGGAVKLGDASQAQLFVCRCEEAADRSCFIQHLQSGAFIEQGENRNLQLALSAASAVVFSKLRAYSEGKETVPKDSVWLRAATGGIVCSDSHNQLAVTIHADEGCASQHCAFSFINADANSVLMKGLAHHTVPAEDQMTVLSAVSSQGTAPVSIGAKPLSPPYGHNKSAAMPIALSRPIRKVSFSDLSSLDHSAGSDGSSQKSMMLRGALPRNSGSFGRSYTHKDAFTDKIPASPGSFHLHSEGSDTDESKVRGGHLYDHESMSDLDEAFSGITQTPASRTPQDLPSTPNQPSNLLTSHSDPSSASESSQAAPPRQSRRLSVERDEQHKRHNVVSDQHSVARPSAQSGDIEGVSVPVLPAQLDSRLTGSSSLPAPQPDEATSPEQSSHTGPASSQHAQLSNGGVDEESRSGGQMHGACLYKKAGPGMRSTRSTSALSKIVNRLPGANHRAVKGHRTHGSQTALSFLSGGWSPSSPHRIPRAPETAPSNIEAAGKLVASALDITQSAPAAEGLLANDGIQLAQELSHRHSHGLPPGQSHGQSHGWQSGQISWPAKSGTGFRFPASQHSRFEAVWGHHRGYQDASDALAGLSLGRSSGEHQRDPVLPCISECAPSQDPADGKGLDIMQPDASKPRSPSMTNTLLDSTEAPRSSSHHPGMKRACSSPALSNPDSIFLHPIHKVTPKGSPSHPSSPKRLHTHHGALDSLVTSKSQLPTFGSPVKV